MATRLKPAQCFWCECEYDPKDFRHYKINDVMYWICGDCTDWSIISLMKSFLEKHPNFHKKELVK